MSEFLKRLSRLYSKPIQSDQFGRRSALPSEIQKLIDQDEVEFNESTLSQYLPSLIDLSSKNDRIDPEN
jgi:hypothetical protein